jgi:hypothetical protein
MRLAKIQGRTTAFWRVLLVGLFAAGMMAPAHAGNREQARRIHDRLAGVPPTDAVLQQMALLSMPP